MTVSADRELGDPVDRLLALLEARQPLLTSRPEFMPRQLAAGALVYAERLLRGVQALARADVGDVTGVLIRAIWECWCLGHYLLLKRDEAAAHLGDYHKFRLAQLARSWPLEDGEEHPFAKLVDMDAKRVELNLSEIAAEVERLVREREHDSGPLRRNTVASYDILYRFESTWASHGGFGAFARYLQSVPEPQRANTLEEYLANSPELERVDASVARARRTEPADAGTAFCALWVALLARAVFLEFGIGVSDLDAITPDLVAAAEEAVPGFPEWLAESPDQ